MREFEPSEISDGEQVAWVTQGVILYFASDFGSVASNAPALRARATWPDLLAAWDVVLGSHFASGFQFVRRWDHPAWQPWSAKHAPSLRRELERDGPRFQYWKVELADRPEFPQLGIDFQRMPASQGVHARASYLRIRLPPDAQPHDVFELTKALCDVLPVQQGTAGYLCHVDEANRDVGFDQAWAWARRYYGVQIVDPVEHTWDAVGGVLGANWLTVIGDGWTAPDAALAAVDFNQVSAPLSVTRARHAVIVRAGNRPLLGDQNQFEDLSAYTLASGLVEPALIQEPTPLPGMFSDHESTPQWIRRFLDPSAWRDSG